MTGTTKVVCIGEVVWDEFPERRVLGGDPVNVAYHLAALGLEVGVITAVGTDDLGRETMARLAALGLPLAGVQENHLPTGRVRISFSDSGEPDFDIVAPAAWDEIKIGPAKRIAGEGYSLVFGTLAQRAETSRETIRDLARAASVCLYDINLRPPFTTIDLVRDSLPLADIVKLNRAELLELGRTLDLGREEEDIARHLLSRYKLVAVIVTCDKDGAWLMTDAATFRVVGEEIEVADPVGAGDAFFAAFIEAYRNGRAWQECLKAANRRGGLVASLPGATPELLMAP